MAKNRYISTRFWDDTYIESLDTEEKLLFLYILTNDSLELCGIYEFSIKIASVRTGVSQKDIFKTLSRFEEDGKIKYDQGWIAIKNFQKHQSTNPKIQTGINRTIKACPPHLVDWVNSIIPQNKNNDDRLSKPIDSISHLTLLNSTLLNSTEREKEIQVLVGQYKKNINKNTVLTDKAKKHITARYKTFTDTQLHHAIIKFFFNTWRMENNADKGLAWFFGSDEQISKFLSLKNDRKAKYINRAGEECDYEDFVFTE